MRSMASSAAPVLAEKRWEPLATARGKSSGAFFFGSFLLGKQKKRTRARSAERFQNKGPRVSATPYPKPQRLTNARYRFFGI